MTQYRPPLQKMQGRPVRLGLVDGNGVFIPHPVPGHFIVRHGKVSFIGFSKSASAFPTALKIKILKSVSAILDVISSLGNALR